MKFHYVSYENIYIGKQNGRLNYGHDAHWWEEFSKEDENSNIT